MPCTWALSYGLAASKTTTVARGSRIRLAVLRRFLGSANTMSSPSRFVQTTVECGRPSGSSVERTAKFVPSKSRRTPSLSVIADDDGGHDGADPEQFGGGRLRRGDRSGDAFLGIAQLGVEASHVGDQLEGELMSGRGHRAVRLDLIQRSGGLSCGYLAWDAARDQFAQHCVEPARQPRAVPAQ